MTPQTTAVLEYLEEYGSIDQLTALTELGTMRLGARIFELRSAGYPIATDFEAVRTRQGQSRIAKYRLIAE